MNKPTPSICCSRAPVDQVTACLFTPRFTASDWLPCPAAAFHVAASDALVACVSFRCVRRRALVQNYCWLHEIRFFVTLIKTQIHFFLDNNGSSRWPRVMKRARKWFQVTGYNYQKQFINHLFLVVSWLESAGEQWRMSHVLQRRRYSACTTE